jgi:uncharacterized iron-regulated membrane protein
MIRNIFVFLHRWIGLLMTVFLVIVGLTGSLLAFNKELEHVFAAKLYATPRTDIPPLDLATLMDRAPVIPHARVVGASSNQKDQATIGYLPEIDPATKKPYDLGFTQFFVDPFTGAELGRRRRGDITEGLVNMMPFVYRLHDKFVPILSSGTGTLVLGIVAVFWTLDCFNGFYLTLPVSLAGFWRKWKTAWSIKRGAGAYRLNLDLHRASGLWLWPILFVFAWSSVMFNLRPVYDWTMSKLMDQPSMFDGLAELKKKMDEAPKRQANAAPAIDAHAALEAGARLAAEQAGKEGRDIPDLAASINYNEKMGAYMFAARSSRAAEDSRDLTLVTIDGVTGEAVELPIMKLMNRTGTRATIDYWLGALHTASVFGLPYKIFVCALGLVIAMLSITGVYIWWKKRKARHFRKTHIAAASAVAATAAVD